MARKKKDVTLDAVEEQVKDNNTAVDEDLYAPFGDKTFSKNEEDSVEETTEETNEVVEQPSSEVVEQPSSEVEEENDGKIAIDLKIQKRPKKENEEQNEFDVKLMKKYVGKNIESIFMKKFNICAFLFQGLYLIYRGIYAIGLSLLTITSAFILFFIDNYVALIIIGVFYTAIGVVLGLRFNKFYIDRCFSKIKDIQDKNEYFSDDQLVSSCKEEGDTSIGVVIVAILVIVGSLYIVINAIKGKSILPDEEKDSEPKTEEKVEVQDSTNTNVNQSTNVDTTNTNVNQSTNVDTTNTTNTDVINVKNDVNITQ